MLMGAMFQRNINLFCGKRFYYKALVFHIFSPECKNSHEPALQNKILKKKYNKTLRNRWRERVFYPQTIMDH